MTVLGIDYGSKKIGLALLNTETEMIFPLKAVLNTRAILADIVKICDEYRIETVVIGLPSSGSIVKKIQRFATNLHQIKNVAIEFVSEDLSSRYAHSMLSSLRDNNAVSIKGFGKKDTFSATVILEEWQTKIKSKHI